MFNMYNSAFFLCFFIFIKAASISSYKILLTILFDLDIMCTVFCSHSTRGASNIQFFVFPRVTCILFRFRDNVFNMCNKAFFFLFFVFFIKASNISSYKIRIPIVFDLEIMCTVSSAIPQEGLVTFNFSFFPDSFIICSECT